MVEAALIGMGLTTPLWEFLLRPALLSADTPIAGQILILVPVFCIAAIMGGLFRVFVDAGPAQNVLRYLFLSLCCTLVGVAVLLLRHRPSGQDHHDAAGSPPREAAIRHS